MQASDDAPGAGMGTPVRLSGHALKVMEGEAKARDYLAQLQAQQADPDELSVILSMLYGVALRGLCRALEKAIGVRHE